MALRFLNFRHSFWVFEFKTPIFNFFVELLSVSVCQRFEFLLAEEIFGIGAFWVVTEGLKSNDSLLQIIAGLNFQVIWGTCGFNWLSLILLPFAQTWSIKLPNFFQSSKLFLSQISTLCLVLPKNGCCLVEGVSEFLFCEII